MPTNFERIKNMNVDEMSELFEALINSFIIAFNMMLKDKNVMIKPKDIQPFKKDIKKLLLEEAEKGD